MEKRKDEWRTEGSFIKDKYMIPESTARTILQRLIQHQDGKRLKQNPSQDRIKAMQIIFGNLVLIRLSPGKEWLRVNYANRRILTKQYPIRGKVYADVLREMEVQGWIIRQRGDFFGGYSSRIKFTKNLTLQDVFDYWELMPDLERNNLLQIKDRQSGEYRPVPNTKLARHLEKQMETINANLLCHQISIDDEPIMIYPTVYRSFSDDLYHGGRINGHYIQNGMNKEQRRNIKIDGEQTVILDYKSMHPSILYAMKGKTIPENIYSGDLDFSYPEERKLLKKALLISLNSTDRNRAPYALMEKIKDDKLPEINKTMANKALDEVCANNEPIKDYMHKDLSTTMMAIESYIAVSILLVMAIQGFPCISIHDAFLCKESDKELLEKIMGYVTYKLFNQSIPASIE